MSDQEISSDHETTTYYRNIQHHHHHQHVFTIATLELEEEGVKEESDTIKQHKRMRSAQLHNHNERLRRQRLKEKMKTLQELIPNCRKRDKSSTFDDAIKYIKTLQHQVQVLSAGAGYSTFNMMPQPEPVQQGMQFPPFLQTGPPSIGMGMSTMLPSLGIPNPWFMPSSDASGLSAPGGISAAKSLQSRGSEPALMQGPISEQSSTRRESTATTRVLPTKIVHSKDVVDQLI